MKEAKAEPRIADLSQARLKQRNGRLYQLAEEVRAV
jgi:hypothetical protein